MATIHDAPGVTATIPTPQAGSTVTANATYIAAKSAWWSNTDSNSGGKTNYQRWVTAHSTVLADLSTASTYFSQSFSFTLASSILPTNDASLRSAAASSGSSHTGTTTANGWDFLELGNYVSPTATVSTINGKAIPGGKLYFAGQPASLGGATGTISRTWLEVLSTSNLTTLIPLTNGTTYTIVYTNL